MSLKEKLRGTLETIFKIGTINLKDNSGIIEGRNAADNAYAIVRGATPSGTNDLTTKGYVDNKSGSYIRRTAGNSQGSSNTFVIIYSTSAESTGSDITYVGSATNGDSFLINASGIYSVSVVALPSAGANTVEIRTGTALDNGLTDSKTRTGVSSGGANYLTHVAWTGYVPSGDSVWVVCGTTVTSNTNYNQISIVRVS